MSHDEFEFRSFLERATGFQIPEDRWHFLAPRFLDRVAGRGFDGVRAYVSYLEHDPLGRTELEEIYALLTVRKTSFFRNPASLDALASEVLPALLRRGADLPVAIWSAGCSTGEEPYSIAMVAKAVLGERAAGYYVLATDIVQEALNTARAATYPEQAASSVPPEYRQYLEIAGGRARVRADVRGLVEFTAHNLVHQRMPRAASGRWDVIFCRNVFIYFSLAQAREVLLRFKEMLAPGGILFLGHAEVFPDIEQDFEVVFYGETFYYRRREDPRLAPIRAASGPTARPEPALPSPEPVARPAPADPNETRAVARSVARHGARPSADPGAATRALARPRALPEVRDPLSESTFRLRRGQGQTPTRAFSRRAIASSTLDETRAIRIGGQGVSLPRDLVLQAEQRLRADDLEAAGRILRAAISRAPRWSWPRVLLARVYMRRGDYSFAERELEAAVEAEPLDPRGHHLHGVLHAARGDQEKAEVCYRRALYLEPELVSARFDLAQTYRALHKFDRACRELRTVLRTLHTIEPARLLALGEASSKEDLSRRCQEEINRMGGSLEDSGAWIVPRTLRDPPSGSR